MASPLSNRSKRTGSETGPVPDATREGSRGAAAVQRGSRRSNPPAMAALVLGLAAAALLVGTELSTLFEVAVGQGPTCEDLAAPALRDTCVTTGGEQHSYALIPIAVLVLGLSVVGFAAAGRAVGAALMVAGAAVLAIALLGDLPDSNRTGLIGRLYEEAGTERRIGLWLELAGGALSIVAGALTLLRGRRAR